jgi:hypothetical protein
VLEAHQRLAKPTRGHKVITKINISIDIAPSGLEFKKWKISKNDLPGPFFYHHFGTIFHIDLKLKILPSPNYECQFAK